MTGTTVAVVTVPISALRLPTPADRPAVPARLASHNAGQCPHSSTHRPWHLDLIIKFADEARAVRFERYLKSGSGLRLR
jgi:hypothetical protein